MLRTLAIGVLVLPSVVFASNEEISRNRNATTTNTTTLASADSDRQANNGVRIADGLPGPWVADLFYQALANFTIQEDVGTSACQKQTQQYIGGLKNNSYWAVKMYDSWSRYPNGLLAGTTHQMGVYNECIDVHRPVQGKYCMTSIKLSVVNGTVFKLTNRDELESFDHAWNEIIGFKDYQDRIRRNEVNIGVCIPESCSATDLEISLQHELNKIFLPHRVQTQVKVEPYLCSTDKHTFPYDIGYYTTSAIMVLICSICCFSTLYHFTILTLNKDTGEKSNIPEFINWFSIIHNGRSLIKYDENNNLNIFNGLKVTAIIFVLFGHKFLYFAMTPLTYAITLENIYKIGPDMLLTCMNMVDPFFYITGFLMYYLLKPQIINRGSGWIQIPNVIIYKYLRILPAYGATMLLTTYFVPYINNGPFWAARMWPEAEKCKNYWWANVLGISNFIDVDHQCLIAGWYISCLLQFIVIGTIIIYICVKNQKVGVVLISVLFCVSLCLPFVLTYTTRSYGIIMVLFSFFENLSNSYEFSNFYRPFYMRGIPFFAGLLAGVLVEELKKKGIKFSTFVVYFWTFAIIFVCTYVQLYGAVFYERHRPYNVIEQSIYATLSHCVWTAILFWVTICHFTSGYGPLERVFNNRFVVPLGRLSYAVYLVNITVMMTLENRQRTSVSPSTEIVLDGWILSTFRTYLVGVALYLFVEAPFNLIIKRIFFGSKNDSHKETA